MRQIHLHHDGYQNPGQISGSTYLARCYSTSSPDLMSKISRMLDMGGAPSGSTSQNNVRVRNTAKNSKVQGVAFDFELLVQAIQAQANDSQPLSSDDQSQKTTTNAKLPSASKVTPNVDQIQEVAKLLKVDLSDPDNQRKSKQSYEKDDLSAILALAQEPDRTSSSPTNKTSVKEQSDGIPQSLRDIRSKYANKLHKKGVDGGLAGVELAKYQREEALKRGDAEGHLAARKIALSQPTGSSSSSAAGTRWMALTGTGKVLGTLTHRCLKIALLPRLKSNSHSKPGSFDSDKTPYERMQDLVKQLKDVEFNVLIDIPANSSDNDQAAIVKSMIAKSLKELSLEAKVVLFVSDQDVYIKEAKELGMMTCRIRPLNARRGNVSAHYTVESILQVHDVINEMNGISFNAVLNM